MKKAKGKALGKLDRFGRYRAHLTDGLELSEKEQIMLRRYRIASLMLQQGMVRAQVVAALQEEFGISVPQAYNIVRDGVKVYGDVSALDRQAMRQALYHRFLLLAQLAERKGDYIAAARNTENAAKLFELFKADVASVGPSKCEQPAILSTYDEGTKEHEMRVL